MIVVAGEALIDLVPGGTGALAPLDPRRGGGPYNTAVALGRLGTPAAFLSRISRDPFGEARTRLALGRRLRRARRVADARGELEIARERFAELRAEPWVRQVEVELGAGSQIGAGHDQLTVQERQVAEVVAGGASNKEAAAQLYLSPKTIEAHLSRIYRKLGISSRTQLAARWDELSGG